jgi:hypothetical protein
VQYDDAILIYFSTTIIPISGATLYSNILIGGGLHGGDMLPCLELRRIVLSLHCFYLFIF